MSADLLRRAAKLMRERAQPARAGRWFTDGGFVLAKWAHDDRPVAQGISGTAKGGTSNGEHIAGMDPTVALAVADWLDQTAADLDVLMTYGTHVPALTVARAYLRDQS